MFQAGKYILALTFSMVLSEQLLASSLPPPVPDCATESPRAIEAYIQIEKLNRHEVGELQMIYQIEATYWQDKLQRLKTPNIRTSLSAANCESAATGLHFLLKPLASEEH